MQKSINIYLPKDKYLNTVINSLPCGKIHKHATGIGATTLELSDLSRNSIIVVPSISLAKNKYLKEKDRHSGIIMDYYASDRKMDVKQKLKRTKELVNDGTNKVKLLIVADSFTMMYREDPEFVKPFFVLYDEVDSFQSEVSYRPILQECINVYTELQEQNRAMISATLAPFSSKLIENEPLTNILTPNAKKPNLLVHFTGENPLKLLTERIKKFKRSKSPKKILVALNNIEEIRHAILLLPEFKSEIGVLCSENNKNKDQIKEYKSTLTHDKLSKPITFTTSAFYVGVDIEESLLCIVYADVNKPSTLLSVSKMIQFYGRGRDKSITRELFLNNSTRRNEKLKPAELVAFVELTLGILHKLEEYKSEGVIKDSIERMKVALIKNSTEEGLLDLPLIELKDNEYRINYIYVDFLIQHFGALKDLYSTQKDALLKLREHFEVSYHDKKDSILSGSESIKIEKARGQSETRKKERLIAILKDPNLSPNSSQEKMVCGILKEYSDIIKPEKTDFLINYLNNKNKTLSGFSKELYKFRDQAEVYSKPLDSKFWKEILLHFKVGEKYTSEEISDHFGKIISVHLVDKIREGDTQVGMVAYFNRIVKTNRKNGKYEFQGLWDVYYYPKSTKSHLANNGTTINL